MTAARGELERQGVAHRRPDDYFAEMMKSDEHMRKIKDKLVQEQKRMAAVEQRRKQKDSLKYLKQVQAERVKAKADEKRAGEDALKQWKRHRGDAEHAASSSGNDFPGGGKGGKKGTSREEQLEAALAGHQKTFDQQRGRSGGSGGPSAHRKAKDRKFGRGGKRDSKDNTAGSSASFRSFSAKRNNTPSGAFAGKGGGGGKFKKSGSGANRPGKRFRSASRGGKR